MDKKLHTFLTLCGTMNYRQAAERLFLSQPAVSKQIQALEAEYGAALFHYDGKRLHKTEKCLILEAYAQSMRYNDEEVRLAMASKERLHLRVGATKTVGDYVIGHQVIRYLQNPDHNLTLMVDNTERLLSLLGDNELDFAIVEGNFDKQRYHHRLFRKEPFVGIVAEAHPFHRVEDLFTQTLIVREKGSGTRRLFEQDLAELGYSLEAFPRVIELSSFHLIREAVAAGLGITFLYQSVVTKKDSFYQFTVEGIRDTHEFNVVSLKNTKGSLYAENFLR